MISMFSQHFFNWTAQLKESGHEVYWIDIFDSNTRVEQIGFVTQIIGWRYKLSYPGRYLIKKKFPAINRLINWYNERELKGFLEKKILEINPDVIHSFVLFQACVPIFSFMVRHPEIKWIYSSWGSDLYFYQNKGAEGHDIKKILPRVNYLFTDCKRDYHIAKNNGFSGKFLGTFPGGGGYDFDKTKNYIREFSERKTILIKGYEGKHGRCKEILKSLIIIKSLLNNVDIVVFGANNSVITYVSKNRFLSKKLIVLGKISHFEVMKLMGKSLIYIGNSKSDGIPNTLLEAIVMEVFPIQSNPGGATAEIIKNGQNGFVIEDPDNSEEVATLLQQALENPSLLKKAIHYNTKNFKSYLERKYIETQVLEQYKFVENQLSGKL